MGCGHRTTEKKNSIIIDSTLRYSLEKSIRFRSDSHFSQFTTPVNVRFYSDGIETNSIIEPFFKMISWYSAHNDTIDLVAHLGEMETAALLVRVTNKKAAVFYLRAGHNQFQKRFQFADQDSLAQFIEVPPAYYSLSLTEIPDTIRKLVIVGHIDMRSGEYLDNRDSLAQKHSISMEFYFRSQYRNFNY